jgi:Asp-tRNA(Asn)/Glu-tRNA(Gln) amidotransferase A subunit family amidase
MTVSVPITGMLLPMLGETKEPDSLSFTLSPGRPVAPQAGTSQKLDTWRMTSKHQALHDMQAWDLALGLQSREIRALDLVRACLDRVAERESQVQAFVQINPDAALRTARALDAGPVRGPLHGLPLGVKDLFDSADLPTGYGSALYAGHQPLADAAALALCRDAGAVLLGKTVTSELANMTPGATRNPHDPAHTPGGSSSGSAAAVASCMLPLALGTQTAGSLIRPAAFCGVVGYKPSHNLVSRAGIKSLSETLDTVGGFARSVRDVALLAAVLTSDATLADARNFEAASAAAPRRGRIGLCRTPEWSWTDPDTQAAWAQAERALGDCASDRLLPAELSGLVEVQKSIQAFETARSLRHEHRHHAAQLSPQLLALLEEGLRISGQTHSRHLQALVTQRQLAARLFDEHDALLAPSAMGEAPEGLSGTGDPLFCRSWTLLGLPCIHLPFFRGRRGLPVGLQLVGAYGQDQALLATAHWVHQRLTQ